MNTVELSVRSKLLQIVEELDAIGAKAEQTNEGLNTFAKTVGKTTQSQIKNTETFLGRLRSMMGSTAKAMGDDFKALFSMAGISEGLKLGSMFRDNIKETFELSDTIRKLANVFGIAQDRFVDFQTKITKGLGDIGLSSESAINSLKGLSETQVRGEDQLLEYSKLAGQLASIGGQKGQEGSIAKGMANTLTAQGRSPNDLSAAKSLAEDLRKSFNATGRSPTEVLTALEGILAKMPQDLRKAMSTSALVKLGTTASVAGPNATKFLEEYLSKSPIARKALEARGFGGVFGAQGLNTQKFKQAAGGVINQFPGDPRLMAQTLGLTEDAAEGFIRLYESIDKVDAAQNKMEKDTKDLATQYDQSMTASEAFGASLNKLKASLAKPIAFSTNFITDGLRKAFKTSLDDVINMLPSGVGEKVKGLKETIAPYIPDALDKNLGSTAVVAGGGVLAALMAGGGLKGLLGMGAGKATGIAEKLAYEQVTGAKVQDVYVVNASEISGGSVNTKGLGVMGGGLAQFAKYAAGIGLAAFAGYKVGEMGMEAIKGTKADKAFDTGAGWLGEKYEQIKEKITGPGYEIKAPTAPMNIRENAPIIPSQAAPTPQNNTYNPTINVHIDGVKKKQSDIKQKVSSSRGVGQ